MKILQNTAYNDLECLALPPTIINQLIENHQEPDTETDVDPSDQEPDTDTDVDPSDQEFDTDTVVDPSDQGRKK